MDVSELAPVTEGQVIGGKYRVGKVIANGGMGVVCQAEHLELQQAVAIKFIRREFLENTTCVQRFLDEARAAASLTGAHVVKMMDVGRLESGVPYMVMERLEGSDLQQIIDAHGPLSISEAVACVLQICDALEEAHAAAIIHRDVKPENVFVAVLGDGRRVVKLVDFGIAKLQRGPSSGRGLTRPRELIGSPWYMSPEQLRSPESVDARTDVWSVGVVLYELLAGAPLFSGNSPAEICRQVLLDQPRPLEVFRADIPGALSAVIARCLEKDRNRRPSTIRELASALEPFANAGAFDGVVVDASKRIDVDALTVPDLRALAPDSKSLRSERVASSPAKVGVRPRAPRRRSTFARPAMLGIVFGVCCTSGFVAAQRTNVAEGWLTPAPLREAPPTTDVPVPKVPIRLWLSAGTLRGTTRRGAPVAEREIARKTAPATGARHPRARDSVAHENGGVRYRTYDEFLREEGLTPLREVLTDLNEQAAATRTEQRGRGPQDPPGP
jgi:serine/threonine-protein kinase